METIICTIITSMAGVAGSYLAITKSNHEQEIKSAQKMQNIEDRINSLENKVDIHNHYAEKIGGIQISLVEMQKDIANLKKG